MKKWICLLLAASLLFTLAACGAKQPEQASPADPKAWEAAGYYTNEDGNILSVTWMDDVVEPGWYVGFMNGEDVIEDSYGGTLPQEGDALRGSLSSSGSRAPITVTLSEEGENGLLLAVEGVGDYHFRRMEMPEATIFVTISTEGMGNIAHAEGEDAPEIDPEYPFQSALINLAEPAVYTMVAWPREDTRFVKWTRNGEDFSTEPQITVLLDESADFVAVFQWDTDGQDGGFS